MHQVENPQTNRLIYIGGATYKRLIKNIGAHKVSKLKRHNTSKGNSFLPKCLNELDTTIPLNKIKPFPYLVKQLHIKWKEGQINKNYTCGQVDEQCNLVDIFAFHTKTKDRHKRIIYMTIPSIPKSGSKRLTLQQKIPPPYAEIFANSQVKLEYIGVKLGIWIIRRLNSIPPNLSNGIDLYFALLNTMFRNGVLCFESIRPKEKIMEEYLKLANHINIKKIIQMAIKSHCIQIKIYVHGGDKKSYFTILNKMNGIDKKKIF